MATIKTTPITAAGAAPALEVTTVTEVITRLAAWLRRLPPPQERIDRLLAELEDRFAGRTEPITQDACAEIERVAWPYSRHLLLQYDRDGAGEPDEEDPGWPEPDPEAILPYAAQVRQVSRLDRGACLIRIDGFESLSIAQPYLDAAFALARGATAIVLDLRSNLGGYPETVAYLAGRLLGDKAVRLSEVTSDRAVASRSTGEHTASEALALQPMICRKFSDPPRPGADREHRLRAQAQRPQRRMTRSARPTCRSSTSYKPSRTAATCALAPTGAN
jgi:Peptidase family S41